MAALQSAQTGSPRPRHRKRFSVSRFSSDTTATLPEYSYQPFELPPEYPDSAEEADEETDQVDFLPISLPRPVSPRRRRLYRSGSLREPNLKTYKYPYNNHTVAQSDTYLDSLLERSVNALELSNTLLQSSMTPAQSIASTTLDAVSSGFETDDIQDARTKRVGLQMRRSLDNHAKCMDDLDHLAKEVDQLVDGDMTQDTPISRSLPSSRPFIPPRRNRRHPSLDLARPNNQYNQRLISDRHHFDSSDEEDHVSPTIPGSSPDASSSYTATRFNYARRSDYSPSPSSSRLPPTTPPLSRISRDSRSSTPGRRSRSRSRSLNKSSPPQMLVRPLPPPIAELPQSDSSTSEDNSQPFRTLESLREILEKQPPAPEGCKSRPSRASSEHRISPAFLPRSPPVSPVTSTSSTTTSISRLFTKGSHSTSTRAPSPPRHSSLKKATPVETTPVGGSTLSIPDLGSPHSRTSSGRSTPMKVAFGPLPESYAESKGGSGTPSKFQEQKEAKKAKSKLKSREGGKRGKDHDREKEESSWWTTWLTGGSVLSMNAARQEERAEDRMARTWGRPGMGVGIDEWPV